MSYFHTGYSMYTEKEVEERIKETLKKHLEPYEDCRRLVFLLASDNNPSIEDVGYYLKIAEEIRSNFRDYYKRKGNI